MLLYRSLKKSDCAIPFMWVDNAGSDQRASFSPAIDEIAEVCAAPVSAIDLINEDNAGHKQNTCSNWHGARQYA